MHLAASLTTSLVQDFLSYKSGVYVPSLFSAPLGGHAIKLSLIHI